MGKVMLAASGKGGTGKTSFCSGVATALAEFGISVLVIDADAGMRNLDLTLGLTEEAVFTFADVAAKRIHLMNAAVPCRTRPNLYLLSAPASEDISDVSAEGADFLITQARKHFDWVIIDCPAGFDGSLNFFAKLCDKAAIITTPDNTAARGAQRMAEFLEINGISDIKLVVNRIVPKLMEKGTCPNVDDLMDICGLPLLGIIPEDKAILKAAQRGIPLLDRTFRGAGLAFHNIAARLRGKSVHLMKI